MSSWVPAQAHLDQGAQITSRSSGRAVESPDQLLPVDRVDGVDVGSQRGGLVGLQLTNEVNLKTGPHLPRQGGDLGRRLLIAALPDVRHAERAEHLDVGAR